VLQGIKFLEVAILDLSRFCGNKKTSVNAVMLEAVGIDKTRYLTLENRVVTVCTIELNALNS
jgi:hypothetical protein